MKKNNDSQAKNNAGSDKKKSSALNAVANVGRATENVKPKASRDVNGESGLKNTGSNVSYEERD